MSDTSKMARLGRDIGYGHHVIVKLDGREHWLKEEEASELIGDMKEALGVASADTSGEAETRRIERADVVAYIRDWAGRLDPVYDCVARGLINEIAGGIKDGAHEGVAGLSTPVPK